MYGFILFQDLKSNRERLDLAGDIAQWSVSRRVCLGKSWPTLPEASKHSCGISRSSL